MADETDMAALLGSRLCHDLVSPLGAIGNGIELLSMEGRASPELTLIAEAAENANARLRFFRIAFGSAAGEQRIGRREVVQVLEQYSAGGRLKVDWQIEGDPPRGRVKAAFLALLCLETAMPWGGSVVLRDGPRWQGEGTGRRLRIEPALWEGLAGAAPMPPLEPATVQFALLASAAGGGRRPSVEIGEQRIALRF